MSDRTRTARLIVLLTSLGSLATACGGPPPGGAGVRPPTTTTSVAPATTGERHATATGAAPSPRPTTPTSPPAPATPATCAATLVDRLTPAQRVGQLVMIGISADARPEAERAVSEHAVGNAFFIGGWRDVDAVRPISDAMQEAARRSGTGLGLLVAADQEGGKVQQLKGEGFPPVPSAVRQARLAPEELRSLATRLGRTLTAAGVNLDLAPVADTVDPRLGRANEPIGRWDRQYATDPQQVGPPVSAFITGLHAAGVGATIKHFPGIGRVRANTDFSATGIDDPVMTVRDAYLEPFADGIAAGADVVMVATARYPRIDPTTHAAFSRPIVTELLRGRLGYQGVVATDDLGVAASVRSVPTGQRAVRFVRAGGDLALTGIATDGPRMTAALLAEAGRDPAFAAQVRAAAIRVVALKVRRGLARCG
ncbi:glycoside hydrolase family 3 N-terminal domain-containing protein [Arsenicicoccus dermatophilus]|uniref:glycoside hydrolase family 3 N-terminal domain-containing protein n=1 Tax=Arsenicicoccus dermatophilus TaxID=1076331 RepID=UPI003917479B